MSRPELTIVIPTRGRATLERCLESMFPRHHGGYRPEVMVVADTHSPLLMDVELRARIFGARYVEHDAGRHDWGYPQLQVGYALATGSHILNIGDDDVYTEGAFEMIRAAIEASDPGPRLFRAEMHPSPNRGNTEPVLLWAERGRFERQHITGQNLCTPNATGRLGMWTDDFAHAEMVVAAWGGQVAWRDEIIARCY